MGQHHKNKEMCTVSVVFSIILFNPCIYAVLHNIRENRKVKNIFDCKELISINGSWPPIIIEVS
jgi:hypothetical protein